VGQDPPQANEGKPRPASGKQRSGGERKEPPSEGKDPNQDAGKPGNRKSPKEEILTDLKGGGHKRACTTGNFRGGERQK